MTDNNVGRDELRGVLVEVLVEIQELSGEETPDIGEDTRPMVDLADFDSLSAAEAIVQLSQRLSLKLNPKLFQPEGDKPLTIGEITDRLCQIMDAEGANRG